MSVIGVDIGGTKVAAGLVRENGEILKKTRTPMPAKGDAATALAAVKTAIDDLLSDPSLKYDVQGIGICAPGPLDPRTGIVINPPNLPCWRNFPLAEEVSRIYGVRAKVDNDANAAALAEVLWGAGRGYRNVFYATVGTGIGTGIVFDGRIFHGRTGAAGEGGHVSIDMRGPLCGCGKRGCIEALASGPAIASRARHKVADKPGSMLIELANGSADNITGEMVGKACMAGDPVAREVLEETVDLIAFWLGNIVDLLEPDVIIMGGGVSSMLAQFIPEISKQWVGACINPWPQQIPIVSARYGEDAGIAGAASLCETRVAQQVKVNA